MTVPRWIDERPPLVIETSRLPVTFLLLANDERRHRGSGPVYLEMRNPSGVVYVMTTTEGIDRMHYDDVYAARCIFDRFGSWYLTWHGLTDRDTERTTPILVEVVEVEEDVPVQV